MGKVIGRSPLEDMAELREQLEERLLIEDLVLYLPPIRTPRRVVAGLLGIRAARLDHGLAVQRAVHQALVAELVPASAR